MLGLIAVSWGIVAASMAAVNSRAAFLTVRFLLGIAEAGTVPGRGWQSKCESSACRRRCCFVVLRVAEMVGMQLCFINSQAAGAVASHGTHAATLPVPTPNLWRCCLAVLQGSGPTYRRCTRQTTSLCQLPTTWQARGNWMGWSRASLRLNDTTVTPTLACLSLSRPAGITAAQALGAPLAAGLLTLNGAADMSGKLTR